MVNNKCFIVLSRNSLTMFKNRTKTDTGGQI